MRVLRRQRVAPPQLSRTGMGGGLPEKELVSLALKLLIEVANVVGLLLARASEGRTKGSFGRLTCLYHLRCSVWMATVAHKGHVLHRISLLHVSKQALTGSILSARTKLTALTALVLWINHLHQLQEAGHLNRSLHGYPLRCPFCPPLWILWCLFSKGRLPGDWLCCWPCPPPA